MLLTYIAEIYLSTIQLCFTFAEPFGDIFLFVKSSCALVSGNINKRLGPKEWRIDRSTHQASEFALAHLTPILHFCEIVVKMTSTTGRCIPASSSVTKGKLFHAKKGCVFFTLYTTYQEASRSECFSLIVSLPQVCRHFICRCNISADKGIRPLRCQI